jgi:hypothetical protein
MTAPDRPPVLQLWELDQPLEPVQFVKDGPSYAFLPIDGIGQQLALGLDGKPYQERLATMVMIVRRCLPEAPADLVAALTYQKLDLLIALASQQARTVEEYLGKFSAEADTASTSATPSATPSPASPRRSTGRPRKSGGNPTGGPSTTGCSSTR